MNIQLSISLLASNRAASLERCLDSLRPLLMQVPSELIVVFTGTDKKVKEIASRYTDKIIPFTWCDNFSAARNVGLWAAKGEWFMYIDDDEWFEDVTEIRDFFLSGEYRRYGSAFYVQKNYIRWDGIQYMDYHAFRMVRIVPGTAFQNMVHEELVPRITPSKYFNAYVNHYGYIKDAGDGKPVKPLRNIPLLLQNIKECPSYVKNYIQITQEYIIVKNYEKAEEYCRKGRELCKDSKDKYYQSWLQANLLYILCVKKEYEKAEQEALFILEQEHPWELVRLNIYETLLAIYTRRRAYEETLHYGAKFEETLAYMEEHPELWRQQAYADLTEDSIKLPSKLYQIWINCTEFALKLEDTKQAIRFMEQLPWEDEIWMQRYYPIFDSWKSSYESFDEILSHIPESSPYQLLQMAASREGSGRETEERRKLFVQCVETTESSYLKHQAVKEAILLRMELGEIVSAMDLEEWRQCAKKLQHLVGPEESETLKMAAEKLVQDVPVYGLWLKKLLCEKELIEGFLVGDVMLQTLKEYCGYVLRFYQIQYRDEMFSREKRILLPKDCRFALYVWEALDQLEAAEFPEAVRLFRKALRFYPSMTGTIREIIRLISRKAETPAQNTGDEFRMLAQQMKESLRSMINSKQYTQAMSVILQLSPLLPEDLELLRMRQNLLHKMAESNTP
jgi:glycosyltransferase involved in cell wall biosynthesis